VVTKDGKVQVISQFSNNYEAVKEISEAYYSNICELGNCGPSLAALRRDGTVDCTSAYDFMEDWTDIVEIEAGYGVKSDGSILYVEEYMDDFTPEQLDEIRTWRVMVDPDTIPAGK